MKVMAFNGSPRKKRWNTITLLENALEGAQSAGAETELVHLYDLSFSGCISCFSCKKIERKENGVCAVKDDLTPILVQIKEEISPRQRVHLVFELPNLPREDPVEARGEVTRVVIRRGEQIGLAFRLSHLRTHHAQAIQDFVDKMAR